MDEVLDFLKDLKNRPSAYKKRDIQRLRGDFQNMKNTKTRKTS